jgi:MurNAc alpha-1-phosphate uridylyltransferase
MEAHLSGRVHLSFEDPPLGTAGAVARLRPWLDGRDVVVVNGDTWHTADLSALVDGWDGHRVRVAVAGGAGAALTPRSLVIGSVLPAGRVGALAEEPSGLYEVCWRDDRRNGRLDVVAFDGRVVACDRPRDYLAANLATSGGEPVVGDGAVVEGALVRSVVWPGGIVRAGEVLVDAVRVGDRLTVLVR